MKWLAWKDGRRLGPLTDADLDALIQAGELTGAHAVCAADSNTWMPLGRVPDLARRLPATDRFDEGDAPQPPDTSAVPQPVSPADAAWIVRHWRGDLPLARSYWVNGTLVSLLLGATARAVALAVDFPSAPRVWAATMIVLWLWLVLVIVWQIVGVWRSAGKHPSRGGSKGWAIAARAAMALGCVQVGAVMATNWLPQAREFALMVANRDPIGGYQIRLLRGASEMEISGDIAFGLTDRVAASLDAHPAITLIHLNSRGGRVAEARKLGDLIAARHLSTYTSRQCTSACVIAFLAGERRLMAPDAKIGFHQYTIAGRSGTMTLADMEKDRRYFLSRGVLPAFVSRAFRATSEFWYPTPEEMLAARYITGYADRSDVALSGMLPAEIEKMEQTLREEPLYGAIAEVDPEAYRQLAADAKEAFRQGQSMAELRARTLPIVRQVYTKRLPFASDEAMAGFAQLMRDQIALLRESPEACVQYVSPDPNLSSRLVSLFGKDLVEREQAVMADVVRSGATGGWQPPGDAEVEPVVLEVSAGLRGARLFGDPADMSFERAIDDSARACDFYYEYYRFIADLPPQKVGPLLRHFFSKLAQKASS